MRIKIPKMPNRREIEEMLPAEREQLWADCRVAISALASVERNVVEVRREARKPMSAERIKRLIRGVNV